jgi:heterodisulfide reductase subunit A2
VACGNGKTRRRLKKNDLRKRTGGVRIGFYVCHCGHNIAAMVDCPAVAKYVGALPNVALSRDYKYMCSDPGQELIQQDIGAQAQPGRRGLVLAAVARAHLPRRHRRAG